MSYSVIRMQKFKMHDVKGLQIHNQRERESRTNPDIDRERIRENYELHNGEPIDYRERIEEIYKENVTSGLTRRKDAVVQCEFMVTSDKQFFDGLKPEEQERFFKESYEFLKERYGAENVIHATVHLDEKTPHMHVGIVPIRDGRLSAKRIFDRRELKSLQTDYNAHVREKGFDLQRGEPSDRKHIETTRWKAQQAKENLKEVSKDLDREKERLERVSERLRGIQKHGQQIDEIEVKEKGVFKKDRVEVSRKDWDQLKGQAKAAAVYKMQGEKLADTVEWQARELETYKRHAEKLSQRVDQLERAEKALERVAEAIDRMGIREDVVKELGEMEKEQQAERAMDRGELER